jgi:hypothetical protein
MRFLPRLALLVVMLMVFGCAPAEKKPSYADLVVIYNAEAETLERLERKRANMVMEYEASLRPSEGEALEALAGVLGGLGEAAADSPKMDATDPNELLDQAVANAESRSAQTDALIEAATQGMGNSPADRAALEAMYSDDFKAKLGELDADIAKQRERVEKARAARDAAEAE